MKRKILKSISVFVALNFLVTTLAPTISYALTAGPTAPEYTSFEPIDTTDMVNLATGDFTYNIPLLEVPGPEGGYPLALSYHAGISPEEEASWVGLGWSLNAGAINRMVNMHPDDMKNELVAIHDTWSGGETEVYSVGVGIGIEGILGVGVGIDFANDTYKGSGTGVNASIGMGLAGNANGSVGIGISAGLGPYGGGYVGLGLSVGTAGDGASASGSIGLNLSFGNGETQLAGTAGASVSYSKDKSGPNGHQAENSLSLLGANISTNSSRPSMSPGGISVSAISDNSTNVSSTSKGFSIPIPIPYTPLSINIGYRKTKYWIDAYDHEKQLGTLYAYNQNGEDHKISFDAYSLKSKYSNDPFFEKENMFNSGGVLPAYDSYNVVGQGLSGSIQPYLFEGSAVTQKLKWKVDEEDENLEYPELGYNYDYDFKKINNSKVSFRFMNEFSNSMVVENSSSVDNTLESYRNISFKIGINQLGYDAVSKDFNKSTGALAGAKHVEWFTNAEINNAFTPANDDYPNIALAKGFIPNITNRDTYFENGIYGTSAPNNIGGFMITNSSGVNYHYAQPVYNFDETQVSTSKTFEDGTQVDSYRRIEKPTPYAYSWLLTGLTGPDYVDRGIIGEIDEADWGYWVKFEYGKWTDQYIWRSPNEGYEKDVWSEWKSYGAGKKELYYLNAIITRTHTALFVKELRQDSKGVKDRDEGGFGIQKEEEIVLKCSAPALRLSRVLLFSNRTLSKAMEEVLSIEAVDENNNVKQLIGTRDELYRKSTISNPTLNNLALFHWENVLTEADINIELKNRAGRQIEFEHDYDLCQSTPNSFLVNYSTFTEEAEVKTGKLTLNRINFLGYNSNKIVPPTIFTYYNPSNYIKDKKDVWGMYKSDLTTPINKHIYQSTTKLSSDFVHAWSLEKISSGIGSDIDIEYESDKYRTVVVVPFYNFTVDDFSAVEGNTNQMKFKILSSEKLTNIPELNKQNATVEFNFTFTYYGLGSENPAYLYPISINPSVPIVGVGDDYIIIDKSSIPELSFYPPASGYSFNFFAGNIKIRRDANTETYGGGLRVASISLTSDYVTNKTKYAYSNGVTAYEPFDFNFKYSETIDINDPTEGLNVKSILRTFYDDYIDIIANTSFLPSPGVIYENVTVTEEVITKDPITEIETIMQGLNYTTFSFGTFNVSMMPRREDISITNVASNKGVKKVKFRDYRNFIGALKETTIRSTATNAIIKKTTNKYLHDDLEDYNTEYPLLLSNFYTNQGRIEHLYFSKRNLNIKNVSTSNEFLLITEVEEYPLVSIGQEVLNGKTNIKKESKIVSFDYYTGSPLSTYYKDGMGNHYLQSSIPAYNIFENEVYVYDEMGLKVKNSSNKNMLTQMAGAITHVVNAPSSEPLSYIDYDFTKIGVMTASAQKWLKNGVGIVYPVTVPDNKKDYHLQNVWLKGSAYTWIGSESATLREDGMYPLSSYSTFNYSNGTLNPQWQLQEEITKYDVYSHALEARDLNGKYSSILMDPLNIQVTASASLAERSEIAYSGSEFSSYIDKEEGAVGFGDGEAVQSNFHTGKSSLAVGSGGNQKGFTFSFLPKQGRKYHSSVWVYQPGGVKADGSSTQFMPRLIAVNKNTGQIIATGLPSEAQKAAGFYRLAIDISPTNSTDQIEVYCLNANSEGDKPQYFDDFRVHPLDASFTSYVYDLDKGWLTYILDGDNLYSRFEYDDAGKLKAVYKELFRVNEKLVTKNQYHYGKE